MDAAAKKTALRGINYGLYVLTARDGDDVAAASVNWVSQASFEPPLVIAGVKNDSGADALIRSSKAFAVNVLAGDQLDIGRAFFRSTERSGDTINGHTFVDGPTTGSPLLPELPMWFECRLTDTIERGDHTIFVGEVVDAGVNDAEATPLLLRDTGMFYGG